MSLDTIKTKNAVKRSKYLFIYGFLAYPLLNFIVFYVIINFNSILLCFQQTDAETFKSVWVGFDNFKKVIKELSNNGKLLLYMWNSIKFFFITFIIGTPLNILFGYLFVVNVKGSAFWRFCIMIPTFISGMVTSMLLGKFAENAMPVLFDKWFNIKTISLLRDERYNFGTLCFFVLLTGFSSNIIIYANAMKGSGESLFEYARLEGASHIQRMWHICLPSLYPILVTFIVTGLPGLLAGDPGLYVYYGYGAPDSVKTTGYYMFILSKNDNAAVIDYSYAATIGMICTLIAFPITIGVRKLLDHFDPNNDI